MDPTTTFCPNLACPASGHIGQGNIGIHSCKDKRFICTECHKTFSATKGTAFYRLRTSAETVSLVVTLMAHGCPLQAIVVAVALAYARGTVACWLARAGGQGQAVQEHVVEQPRDLGQVQADEIRVKKQGGVVNTASIERLNATFRERLASLTRRGRALARRTRTLQHGMYLIGTVYNFCTPHASLAHAGRGTTPAMAAGITDHCWPVRDLLSLHVPPPHWTPPPQRGRPSQALKRLIARWCGDHG